MDQLPKAIGEVEKLLTRNRIFLDRTEGIGEISKEDALAYGLTGPNLRACGIDLDLRKDKPYSGYEQYDFDVPIGTRGDCYDRYLCQMDEKELHCYREKYFNSKMIKVMKNNSGLIQHATVLN